MSHPAERNFAAMFELLDPIVNFFMTLYSADKRPEARRFTIGCFIVVLLVVLLIGAIYSISSV